MSDVHGELIDESFGKTETKSLVWDGRDVGRVIVDSTTYTGGDYNIAVTVRLNCEDLNLVGQLSYAYTARGPQRVPGLELREFLEATVWAAWGSCGHQHDCCGCVIYRQPSAWEVKDGGIALVSSQHGVRNV